MTEKWRKHWQVRSCRPACVTVIFHLATGNNNSLITVNSFRIHQNIPLLVQNYSFKADMALRFTLCVTCIIQNC